MQLYELVQDKRYLNYKLGINEELKRLSEPHFKSGASFSTFVNNICTNFDIANLVTDAGVDWWHAQLLINTSAGTRGSNFIAISESTSNPLDTWTTLASEITTGGLSRAVSSPAANHIVGTNVSVLEKTFTASANFNTGIRLVGLFNVTGPPPAGILNHVGILDKVTQVPSGSQFRVLCTMTFP
jgi:hypothetical protein